jgi:hypothetical protein
MGRREATHYFHENISPPVYYGIIFKNFIVFFSSARKQRKLITQVSALVVQSFG